MERLSMNEAKYERRISIFEIRTYRYKLRGIPLESLSNCTFMTESTKGPGGIKFPQ